tara:strand:+ start:190 stop:1140 length:951 start_codon:yes stop_codon:yes gene_type:complete
MPQQCHLTKEERLAISSACKMLMGSCDMAEILRRARPGHGDAENARVIRVLRWMLLRQHRKARRFVPLPSNDWGGLQTAMCFEYKLLYAHAAHEKVVCWTKWTTSLEEGMPDYDAEERGHAMSKALAAWYMFVLMRRLPEGVARQIQLMIDQFQRTTSVKERRACLQRLTVTSQRHRHKHAVTWFFLLLPIAEREARGAHSAGLGGPTLRPLLARHLRLLQPISGPGDKRKRRQPLDPLQPDAGGSHAHKKQRAFTCAVCMVREVDRTLECGHALCALCVTQLTATDGAMSCPHCRKSTSQPPRRLFLSSSVCTPL